MKAVVVISVLCIAAILTATPAVHAQQEQQTEPFDVGLEEEVNVQFVLVDFLVLDRKDRTVPDLKLEEFQVHALALSPST